MTKANETIYAMQSTKIQELFVLTGFIATIIFFILNTDKFSTIEILTGSFFSLVLLQSIYYVMLGFVTIQTNIDIVNDDIQLQNSIDRIDAALNELASQSTTNNV